MKCKHKKPGIRSCARPKRSFFWRAGRSRSASFTKLASGEKSSGKPRSDVDLLWALRYCSELGASVSGAWGVDDENSSDRPQHVSAPRVWIIRAVESSSRPSRRRNLRRSRPLPYIVHNVGPPWSMFQAARWSQRRATARVGALPRKTWILERFSKIWNA